jgi:hypothetical protein
MEESRQTTMSALFITLYINTEQSSTAVFCFAIQPARLEDTG